MVYRKSKKRVRSRGRKSNLVKTIKSIVNKNIENKYQTYDLSVGASSLGQLININVLAQGTQANQRVGNRVKFTSVRFNGYWTQSDATNIVRMMVLWSRSSLLISNMPNVAAPINPAQQNFKVLYDHSYTLENIASSGIQQRVLPRTIYRKINGNSTYDDATTTPEAGYLYFYFISDSAIAGHPTFAGQAIMSFQDA